MIFLKRHKWLLWMLLFCFSLTLFLLLLQRPKPIADRRSHLSLEQRIEISLDLARYKLTNTIYYLKQSFGDNWYYPIYTQAEPFQDKFRNLLRNPFKKRQELPDGIWLTEKVSSWAAGAFPGLLWKMSVYETDPALKKFWINEAKTWGEPLRKLADTKKDISMNNLFVFQPWFENASGQEKTEQLETILRGARKLAEPYHYGQGNFHIDIGVMGFENKATRTDNQLHWQAFIDHTINVEQLLWAANHDPNLEEANDWRNTAIRHLKTIGKTFGKNRHPGNAGTWQRGYFDDNSNSPTYSQFLFNEGKQGWGDNSTWSRGQAWVIYGASVTYKYTKDPEVLAIAKEAINYYLAHLPDQFPGQLRRPGDFIPPWDFDYALEKNPDTERDSSAAAIAVSGMLKLLQVLPHADPDWQRYFQAVKNSLMALTSTDYLPDKNEPEMSLLKHGCYHHFASITPNSIYDSGLIWGDYFFLDALVEYQQL
jgi:hypothetical protein